MQLFLVEGTQQVVQQNKVVTEVRRSILPLRGKDFLNMEKPCNTKAFESEEIRNIYTALG